MKSLKITATIPGPISIPNGPIAIDALLAYHVVLRSGTRPALTAEECQPVEIPILREPQGRFHLASWSLGKLEHFELRHTHRRAPIEQYQAFGMKGTVRIAAGPDKSYRKPLEVGHLENSELVWYCIGDDKAIAELLSACCYVGSKRAVGLGAVTRWELTEVAPWDGFPVLRDGDPLRALPLDWPGLSETAPQAFRTITYPYWDVTKEELLACPVW